jgi:Carboxypeptidase regulatory-like domain/TonB-dependent Receptor Plug Domain/TonB dependent receptor
VFGFSLSSGEYGAPNFPILRKGCQNFGKALGEYSWRVGEVEMRKSAERRVIRQSSYWVSVSATILLALTLALPSSAQNATGRITGVVTDPQGAAVPGAKIRVTNVSTNVHWVVVSNEDGAYQVLDLPIGSYKVDVERQGFAKTVTDVQALEINQTLRIDIRMKVGSVSETVSVEAQAAQVETANPTLGSTVTGATIQNLPLNGRNTLDLALTQPGVVPIADDLGAYGTSNGGSNGLGGISIAGGRGDAVTYLLDGGINNRVTSNQVVFNPNPEAVEEFRLLENNYTAEYGRNGGGTISEVIKSGTNSLHGSLYDYVRNDAFNASTFFDNAQGNPRPILKRNQFGGTVGGPITLPKLVNGKDRFFFFFGYQGQRQTATVHPQGSTGKVSTYTPAELGGDFSQAASNGGVDPFAACFLSGLNHNNPGFTDGTVCQVNNPSGSGTIPGIPHPFYQSDPAKAFNGIIDPTKFDSVAQKFIAAGLIPTSPTGLVLPEGRETDNVDQYLGKFDFYATQNDRITLTVGTNKEPILNPFFGANVPGFSSNATTWDYFANIGYTKTFSSTMLNEFHATGQRWYQTTVPASHPPALAALGINVNSDDPFGPPQVSFNSGMLIGFDPNVHWKSDNTYAFTDTLTWSRGRHTWKFGGRFAILQENSVYAYQTNGIFYLYGTGTTVGSGNDLADFLLGAPDEFYQSSKAPSNEHQRQYAAFAQDEWKVTPRLTLTLGLRYEYTSPETDKRGFSFSIIPGAQSQKFVNSPPGLVYPGDPGSPRGWYFPDYKDFAPRVGFAWDPFGNGKTSLRGGFGMFYDTLNGWMSDWATDEPPFAASADIFFSPSPANAANTILSHPYETAGSPDPFPSQIPPPQNVNFAQLWLIPNGFGNSNNNFVDPHLKTPYIYQYNLSIERQVGNGLMAEVGYVGSSSHKLLTWLDANPFVPGTNTRLLNQGLASPNFGYLTTFAGKNNANYNGLLASLTKRETNVRYLGQVFFTLAYTWSHNLDNGSGFNSRNTQIASYNHHALYGNSDFNVPQRLTFGGGWELPFAKAWSGGPKRLTTGWSLYPIVFAQSGIPLDVLAGIHQTASKPGPSGAGDPEIVRANQVVNSIQTLDPHLPGHFWFNPNDFQLDPCIAAGTCPFGFYGTYRRNSFRGPKHVNFDLSLEKATNLVGERARLIFRAEAYNIFNHTEFRPPAATHITDGTFGLISGTYDPRILQLALRLTF